MSFLNNDRKFAIRELRIPIIADIETSQNSGQNRVATLRRCNASVPMRKVLDILRGWGHCLGLFQLTVAGNIREFKNDVGDGNVSKTATSRRLNIYRIYSTSFNLSNVDEFLWS